MRFQAFVLPVALIACAAPALAQEFKAGDIVVEKPWARATPKGAEVGAGYFTIRNKGPTPDHLTGVTVDFATAEIHEMKSDAGVIKMRELTGGLNIPAHGAIGLAPGGYHLMFTHLTHPLTKDDTFKATLIFEHAGTIEVEFPVVAAGASGGGKKPGDMGGMKM